MVHENFQMDDLLSPRTVDIISIPGQEHPLESLANGLCGNMFRWAAKHQIKVDENGKLGFLMNRSPELIGGIFMFYGVDLFQTSPK